MRFFLRILISYQVLFVLLPSPWGEGLGVKCSATHLMGGWTGYQYLGLNSASGNYKYQVTFKLYRYCDDMVGPCGSNACTNAPLDNSIQMGAYVQDFLNPNDPNKVLYSAFTIPLSSQSWVPLPGAGQCASAPIVCVEEGIYSMQIELPASNGGYHLLFERCCRNSSIINLATPLTEGMSFYAFIPPTFINNSSAVLAKPPVPYICANDTASILNTAIDPDGDVIIYSLVQPYTTSTQNAVNPPPNPYTFPIPPVTYAAGYSAGQPFGPSGYAGINSFTGLSQYFSPNTGNYVVAVEIQEYRNNQLVGISRLDMQIIVITCPPNNAPALSSTTSQTSYVANEGDSLCFPITFSDVNGDSVFLNAAGTLFGPPVNPPATLTPNPNSGLGTITSQFCWDLDCGQSGNYIFIVQSPDNGCPPKMANVVYTIQVLPFVGPNTIAGPNPICGNSTGTYSVPPTSGTTFTWTVTNGNIISGQGTNTVDVTWSNAAGGTISVTAYNSRGCPATPVTQNIVLMAVPVVTAGTDATVCAGVPVSLTSSGGPTYSWSPIKGLNNPNISNPVATPTVSTNYTVTVTDANTCTASAVVQVTIKPLPLPKAGPKPGWVCPGFSVTLSSANGATYSWNPTGSLNNPNISNPVSTPSATTHYTVSIVGANGCSNKDTVTISYGPIVPTNAGKNVSICIGQSAVLGANPTAPINTTSYLWSPSVWLSNTTIANPTATPPVGTWTYNVATTSNTCSGSDAIVVVVKPLPVINAGPDVSICKGDVTTLTASGGKTYVWNTGSSTTSISAAPTTFTTYTVTGTGVNGCKNKDDVAVFVKPLPVISASPDVSVCSGNTATLTGSGGQTYVWSTGETTTSILVSVTAAATYTVTGTGSNGCSSRDSVSVFINASPAVSAGPDISVCIGSTGTLTGSGGQTYVWSTGETTTSIIVLPTSITTYTVTGANANGCTNVDFITVFINPLPSVNAGPDASVCSGSATTLTGSGGQTYAWSPPGTLSNPNISNPVATPTINTTYTLTATDINTCSNTDSVNITLLPLPSILTSNDTIVCAGDSAFLNASGGINYSWSPASSLNISTISNPIATPTITTTYTTTVTNSDGCVNIDSVKVSVNPSPPIDAGTNAVSCAGQPVTLNATGGVTYVWSPATGLSNPNISDPVVSITGNTTYTVVGTDANGCVNTDSILVSMGIIPTPNFGYSLSLTCEGMETQFSDSSLNATEWSWDFGDGNSSSLQNPSHTFPYNTSYVIILTALNPPCFDTVQKAISVTDISDYLSIETYNVFTPNNDGTNDCFRLNVNGRFAGCADLTIYNRWGIEVYHSDYSGSCWDGHTSAGIAVPEGTYFYIFDLHGTQVKGFVTVLR